MKVKYQIKDKQKIKVKIVNNWMFQIYMTE
jgi:hypothetical protein